MASFIELLRCGAWLTRERIRLVALAVLAASLIAVGYLVGTAQGLNDAWGRPLGTDFSSFYAAGTLVRDGLPTAPYDIAAQYARERAIFGTATQFFSFQYPPFFLLLAAALAPMPYLLAFAVWQGVTLVLYLWAMRSILLIQPWPGPHDDRERSFAGDNLWLLLALAYPAVFVNFCHGQNGFLTASLFGLALVSLDRRPLIAGLLFGLLAYKPQFGLMIPLVLLATGRWRVIAAAAATIAALALITLLAFGSAAWQAFFASMPFTRIVMLEQGAVGWFKIQSVFSWARMWGSPVDLAYMVQGALAVAVATALVWLWRSKAHYPFKAAAILIGTLLATPHSLDYDLMLLAPAIAYLAADGLARGFGPYEKTVLAALWIVPIVARTVPLASDIPLAVPLMLLVFALLLRRAIQEVGALSRWRFAVHSLK